MEGRNVKKDSPQGEEMARRLNRAITEVLGVSYRSFEAKTGLNNVRKMALGEVGITNPTLRAIEKFTNISAEWIRTGKGNVLKGSPDIANMKPRILNYANAGRPMDVTQEQNVDDYMPIVRQLPDYDCTLIIRGDSMEPTYHSGDEVAVKDITDSGFRQWGTPHVLNTSQGILVKRIFADEANKGYKCVSDNKAYEPFVIPESEVYNVFKIVGVIRWEG